MEKSKQRAIEYATMMQNAESKELANLASCYLMIVERYKTFLKETNYFGPFITFQSESKSPAGMPKIIGVCPLYGSDGMALYELKKDYSAPEY